VWNPHVLPGPAWLIEVKCVTITISPVIPTRIVRVVAVAVLVLVRVVIIFGHIAVEVVAIMVPVIV